MKKILIFIFLILSSELLVAQRVYVQNDEFYTCHGQFFINGTNTPWRNWNGLGVNFNKNFWKSEFAKLAQLGINSTRVWISCSPEHSAITIDSNGYISELSAAFWTDLDTLVAYAEQNSIYLMVAPISFDHTKNTYSNYEKWINMYNSAAGRQSFVDNYILPMVNRYKDNDYFFCIDVGNELDWTWEEHGINYQNTQDLIARTANAVHDSSEILVCAGLGAGPKYYVPSYNNLGLNLFSDAQLNARQAGAYVDFWNVHYYDWQNPWFSNPASKTPSFYGLTGKPAIIGECSAKINASYDYATFITKVYDNGWQGIMPWTSNGVDNNGSTADHGSGSSAFAQAHPSLVLHSYDCGSSCVPPYLGPDQSLCSTGSVTLNANVNPAGRTFVWKKNGSVIAGETSSSLNISQGGSYLVEVDSAGCVSSSSVTIADALPAVSLASAAAICGSATITLNSGIAGTGYTYEWKKDNVTISGASLQNYSAGGAGTYSVTVSSPGCSSVTGSVNVIYNIPPASASSSSVCEGQPTTLSSTASGTLHWYTVATGGTEAGNGNNFQVNPTGTTTYYVEAVDPVQTLGKTSREGTSTSWNLGPADFNVSDKVSKVTVSSAVLLRSVAVYVNNNNTNVTINLRSGGNVVATATMNNLTAGKRTIPLYFNIDPGVYTMDLEGSSNEIGFQNNLASFPYEIAGVIKFEHNESWASTWYGSFYDWRIGKGTCLRGAVTVTVDNSCDCSGTFGGSASLDACGICAGGNTGVTPCPVTPVNSPVHKKIPEIKPNPFTTEIIVDISSSAEFKIIDMHGRIISRGITDGKINTEDISPGLYQLLITGERQAFSAKIFKE
jgi:hypothetical protein